jgi:ribosomal protein L29
MKKNDIIALHDASDAELQQKLADLQQELAVARVARAAGKQSLSKVRALADDIARIKTVLRTRQLRAPQPTTDEKETV